MTSDDPPFRFRYVHLPDDTDDGDGPGLVGNMFDPPVMRRLYELGESLGKSLDPWHDGPPPLDDDPQ